MKLTFFILISVFTKVLFAEDRPEYLQKMGGIQFSKCYFCHSLKPGVHMTGPSLANLWGAKAGSVKDFKLYSDSLKKSGIIWDEENLKKWIMEPHALVPGSAMTYSFKGDTDSLKNLIEFLKVATAPKGYETVLEKKLISKDYADGQIPNSWDKVEKENQIKKIEYCDSIFTLHRANGSETRHWEENISLRVSGQNMKSGEDFVKVVPTGSMGDCFIIAFPKVETMLKMIKPCAK